MQRREERGGGNFLKQNSWTPDVVEEDLPACSLQCSWSEIGSSYHSSSHPFSSTFFFCCYTYDLSQVGETNRVPAGEKKEKKGRREEDSYRVSKEYVLRTFLRTERNDI